MTEMKNSRELITELLEKGYQLKQIAEYTGFTEAGLCYIRKGKGISTSLDLWCGLASMLDFGPDGEPEYRWHPEALTAIRSQNGFTQLEFGKRLGLGRSTIINYEDPYGTWPRVSTFISICTFFGVDYRYFVDSKESESRGIA